MFHKLLLSCLLLFLGWSSANSQVVVLGTRRGGQIAGLEFGRGDLVRYDIEFDSASIFSTTPAIDAIGNDKEFDAVHVSQEGDLFFSSQRGGIDIEGSFFNSNEVVSVPASTGEPSSLFNVRSDIAGFVPLSNGNYLISTKTTLNLGGDAFRIGTIVEFDPTTNTGSEFLSADIFLTPEEGGTTPEANIDAIDVLPNGNVLLSTSNTAQIGDSSLDAVRIFQGGVYEYDLSTGAVSTYMDRDVFENSGTDLKAISVLSPVSVLILGDCNFDGVANFLDIGPFIDVLVRSGVSGGFLVEADCNQDGVVNFLDVFSLLQILSGV